MSLKTSLFLHNYESKRFFDDKADQVIAYDVKTKGFMVNLLFGTQSLNYFGETSFGVGIRGINVNNNSLLPVATLSPIHRNSSHREPEEKGNYLIFTVSVNFKFGFPF
jgi:hypothetical protein